MKEVYHIGFTGNRPKNENGRRIQDLEAKRNYVRNALMSANQQDHVLITGLAAGADTIACQEALKLGIPIHLILPCSEKNYSQAFPKEFEGFPKEYLDQAIDIVTEVQSASLPSQITWVNRKDSSYSVYQEINEIILDHAQILITLTNGEVTNLDGGSSEMQKLAEERNLTIINISTI